MVCCQQPSGQFGMANIMAQPSQQCRQLKNCKDPQGKISCKVSKILARKGMFSVQDTCRICASTCKIAVQNSCRKRDIFRLLHVSRKNVQREQCKVLALQILQDIFPGQKMGTELVSFKQSWPLMSY